MRVLQVVSLVSPDGAFGGPARVALNASAELLRRGHDVTIAAATRGLPPGSSTFDGVPVELFPARQWLLTSKFYGMGASGMGRWLHANLATYDVVHVHLARDLVTLPAALSARRHGVPYVVQTHGMVTPSTHPAAAPLDAAWTRPVLRDAAAVCHLTRLERDQLSAVGGHRLRFVEVHNGVPAYDLPTIPQDPPEVLFAARLHGRKKPLAFVAMARMLEASGSRARFTLLGPDGGQGSAVVAATVGCPSITWEGAVDPELLPLRMAEAQVFVLPSVREPYPMAVLEAMSVGLPVVISDDCGLADVVDRTGCGIVTDPSPPSLATAVGKLIDDPVLAGDMGRRGRAVARSEFGMAAVGELLESTYAAAIGDRT